MLKKLKTFDAPSVVFARGIVIGFIAVYLAACSGGGHGNKTTFEYMPDMADSPAVKAQEEPMRAPVPGTIPHGYKAYPFTKDQTALAGEMLKNPLPVTREVLLAGQDRYNTYCIVCHGPVGKGNGTIVPRFPMPPSLNSEKVRGLPDGSIFNVITMGQNLMPAYASQVLEKERWEIIHYIRAIQRSVKPSAEDVELYEQALKAAAEKN